MRRIRKRHHRPEKRRAGQRAGTQQHHGCRNTCAVGIAKRYWTINAVSAPRVFHKVREFESTTPDVALVEHAFGQAAEEAGHSILEYASPR